MVSLPDSVIHLPITARQGDRDLTLNLAAIETTRGLLLLDAGLPGTVDRIADGLAAAGHDLAAVRIVVLTHQDPDHVGGVADLLDRTDAVVVASQAEAPHIDGGEPLEKGDDERPYPPVDVDIEVTPGTRFTTAAGPLEVVATPGHTGGHVSLFLREAGLLFAADALTVEDDTLRGPPEGMTVDRERALAAVADLADLPVATVLAYHGGLIEADGAALAAVANADTEADPAG